MDEIQSGKELENHIRQVSAQTLEKIQQEGLRRQRELQDQGAKQKKDQEERAVQARNQKLDRLRAEGRLALDREKKLTALAYRAQKLGEALDRWLAGLPDAPFWELLEPRLALAAPYFAGTEPTVQVLGLDRAFGLRAAQVLGVVAALPPAEAPPADRGVWVVSGDGRTLFRVTAADLAGELLEKYPQVLASSFFPGEADHG